MAELYDVMVSPHNWMSPLGTMINAHLCAALPNVEILEIDLDDVPWKMDLLTHPFEIEDGHLVVPDRPGWGTAIDESVVAAHPLPADRLA
jgi:L-alanine-DL-glutamate epimerase-like enolase superfamily enzyme